MRVLGLLLLLAIPTVALAQAPAEPPVIRTSLDPTDGIVIGQPVRLNVAVLYPDVMPHPPLVRVPEAAGAQILRFETQATTLSDRIDGRDYVGQNFEFVVFPRRGGEIAVPAPAITLLARNGDPAGSAAGTAMRFSVSVPAGIDPSGPVLVADSVSVSETWSPEPQGRQFRVGDAVVRTIRRQAAGVPALGMAEFRFEAPDGVRTYVDPPVIEDRSNRGSVDGHRSDKVTYVFEKPGTVALPALAQPWWSLADTQARTETLPGLTVTIAAAAQPTPSAPSSSPAIWVLGRGAMAIALIALFALALGKRLIATWRQASARLGGSAWLARLRFWRAARSGEAAASYRAFAIWLDRLSATDRKALQEDRRLAPLLAQLEQAIFGAGSWTKLNGSELARAIAKWCRQQGHNRAAPNVLPPLNPVG
ncbi:MAG TPA: hypothetical protein VGN91_08910 [Bosea sp. (in: a-proteobacteria)]|jgi:hypothetical protein|nr:hypothetical protein [Bosea sp. (in: a-proteobacteria)]